MKKKNNPECIKADPAFTYVFVQLLPIIDLVRGIPCAVTKRRHLRKALLQYLEEFDTSKCAPCPNNARPVLSGTECKCVCQTGTFGTNCELRAPDFTSGAEHHNALRSSDCVRRTLVSMFTSENVVCCVTSTEAVDGHWSSWRPWSRCGASMKRHRTRRCDNPAPLRGGQPCDGPDRQEDPCHISIFER